MLPVEICMKIVQLVIANINIAANFIWNIVCLLDKRCAINCFRIHILLSKQAKKINKFPDP